MPYNCTAVGLAIKKDNEELITKVELMQIKHFFINNYINFWNYYEYTGFIDKISQANKLSAEKIPTFANPFLGIT